MRKPTLCFPTWSKTNQAVQLQEIARGLKFQIQKEEGFYYPCSENKGADQLRGYREADLRLCFHMGKCLFSHDAAQLSELAIYVSEQKKKKKKKQKKKKQYHLKITMFNSRVSSILKI